MPEDDCFEDFAGAGDLINNNTYYKITYSPGDRC